MLTVAPDTRLRAAREGFARLDATLQTELRDEIASWVVPRVLASVRSHARGTLRGRLADTGRYNVFRDVPGIAWGTSTGVTTDGTPGRTLVRSAEYGASGEKVATYEQRSRKGTRYSLTRHTMRQFAPQTPGGSFVAPGVEAVADQVLEQWVQLVEEAGASAWNGEA